MSFAVAPLSDWTGLAGQGRAGRQAGRRVGWDGKMEMLVVGHAGMSAWQQGSMASIELFC